MKPETKILYSTYLYFLKEISNNMHELFYDVDTFTTDFSKFFDTRMYILNEHSCIKYPYRNFIKSRNQLFKKFNEDMIKIKYNETEKVLRSYFCYDITNMILQSLF